MKFEHRTELVLLFDVTQGNPNGDPDAGNSPRIDPETGFGIITDVCIKRKVRNFVAMTKEYKPPYDIYVKERGILAREQKKAYEAVKAEPVVGRTNEDARKWMCDNYFDIRTFGAVMTTGKTGADDGKESKKKEVSTNAETEASLLKKEDSKKKGTKNDPLWNCGQVRGPVQLAFAKSESRITTLEHTITRVALTNPGDTDRAAETDTGEEKAGSGQMGRKHTIPYALYRAHVYISPFLANDTGFQMEDYKVLLEAFTNMFEHDRSAARGEMSMRGLGVFEHDCALGNAPSHKLLESVRVEALVEIPRVFADYKVTAPTSTPDGVKFHWEVAP